MMQQIWLRNCSLFDAIKFMAPTSWGSVTTETIQVCFKVCDEECVSEPEKHGIFTPISIAFYLLSN
jgi:hypothetical protein